MLVLRRRRNEVIVIGGVAVIHILEVERDRVKIGVDAPPEILITRGELLEREGELVPVFGAPLERHEI
jgi:carbon storage regulator